YWGRPTLAQRRRRIFLMADFGGSRAAEILFKARDLQSVFTTCGVSRLSSPTISRIFSQKAGGEKTNRRTFQRKTNGKYSKRKKIFPKKEGGKIPIVRPFQERRMRSTAKEKNEKGFQGSFGKTNDPFPTLLAGSVNNFSFWYEGKEKEGYIRQLTPW